MASREWSIHGKLSLWLITGTGLILLLAAAILYFSIEYWLHKEFDQALESKARALVTLTTQDESGVELDFADEYMPEFEREVEPEYFQVLIDDKNVLERSRSLGRLDLPHNFQGRRDGAQATGQNLKEEHDFPRTSADVPHEEATR